MVKVSLGELKDIGEGMGELANTKLPVKTSYAISKINKQIVAEFQEFDKERVKILDAYSKKGEDGKPVIENNNYVIEDMEAFTKEFNELCAIEVEINAEPISIEQLGDIEISFLTLAKIDKFIKGE